MTRTPAPIDRPTAPSQDFGDEGTVLTRDVVFAAAVNRLAEGAYGDVESVLVVLNKVGSLVHRGDSTADALARWSEAMVEASRARAMSIVQRLDLEFRPRLEEGMMLPFSHIAETDTEVHRAGEVTESGRVWVPRSTLIDLLRLDYESSGPRASADIGRNESAALIQAGLAVSGSDGSLLPSRRLEGLLERASRPHAEQGPRVADLNEVRDVTFGGAFNFAVKAFQALEVDEVVFRYNGTPVTINDRGDDEQSAWGRWNETRTAQQTQHALDRVSQGA